MTALLEVAGLEVAYNGVVAVRDVSFKIRAGEVLAVLGANGAGKTTTLLAISGLVRARGGSVSVDGHSVLGMAPEAIARLGISHVPAGRGIFPGLTVAENLRMGLYGSGREGSAEGRADIERVYDLLPILRDKRDQPAGTMSGGQQQQLAIARALVQKPRLLMLDEMSMGLSPTIVAELFRLVADLRTEGIAVVMVEQFVGQALAVADTAVVLEQGKVVASGTPAELSAEQIGAAYLGARSGSTLSGPPTKARERVSLTLAGHDVRRLSELADSRGMTMDQVLGEIVEQAVAAPTPRRKR